jgi:hypothetical protein
MNELLGDRTGVADLGDHRPRTCACSPRGERYKGSFCCVARHRDSESAAPVSWETLLLPVRSLCPEAGWEYGETPFPAGPELEPGAEHARCYSRRGRPRRGPPVPPPRSRRACCSAAALIDPWQVACWPLWSRVMWLGAIIPRDRGKLPAHARMNCNSA